MKLQGLYTFYLQYQIKGWNFKACEVPKTAVYCCK